jgi:hypothetical protein
LSAQDVSTSALSGGAQCRGGQNGVRGVAVVTIVADAIAARVVHEP